MYFNAPNSHNKQDKKFIIENGLTLRQVVNKLHEEEVIGNPDVFLYISQIVKGYNPTVRYGEYFFERNLSYYKIMHKMVKGYVSFRKITIAEGLSTNTSLKIIDNSHGLIGHLPTNISEGSLLAETYFYSYNDTKMSVIKRMKDAMNKTVDELWENRDRSIPIKTKRDAIILASIVEREAGTPSERPTIASVFSNRLKKGMKLQSDPTIIYSFTFGDTDLERRIRSKDINNQSLYNTYHIYGLPPTPICNPGIDSIKAVLNPPTTNYLYFVASGYGKIHNFSTNLKDHNRFVYQYYKTLRERKAAKKAAAQAQEKTPAESSQ
ncbi:MAG: UPF0755 protein [Myxococcota bacterium]|jgi:UPF0755 protein